MHLLDYLQHASVWWPVAQVPISPLFFLVFFCSQIKLTVDGLTLSTAIQTTCVTPPSALPRYAPLRTAEILSEEPTPSPMPSSPIDSYLSLHGLYRSM